MDKAANQARSMGRGKGTGAALVKASRRPRRSPLADANIYIPLPNPRPHPRAIRGLPRSGGSGLAISHRRGKLQAVIDEIKRGLPFTTPTRLELINTRVRYTVPMLTAPNKPPALLFHPARSIASMVVLNANAAHDMNTLVRSGATNSTALWDWIGSEVTDGTQSVSINASTFGAGEAIGIPSSLVSPMTRVTGGVLTMRITCGPGTTGYLAVSCPAISELVGSTNSIRDLYTAHSTNPRIKRFELTQGTRTHHFIAPITNAPGLEVFETANDRFKWGPHDAFGATLFTFHEINYNSNLGVPPVVELYATVGLQCRLEIADRHLATSHATSTKNGKIDKGTGDGSPHIGETKDGHEHHVGSTLTVTSGKGNGGETKK